MRSSLKVISIFFFVLIKITTSNAFIISQNTSIKLNFGNDIHLINGLKIGIVDFRNILKESLTMKKLGKEFLKLEKRLNDKIKKQEKILRNKELELSSNKNKFSNKRYNIEKNNLKKKITNFQEFAFAEKK